MPNGEGEDLLEHENQIVALYDKKGSDERRWMRSVQNDIRLRGGRAARALRASGLGGAGGLRFSLLVIFFWKIIGKMRGRTTIILPGFFSYCF